MTDIAERLATIAADPTDEQAALLAEQLSVLIENPDGRTPQQLAEQLSEQLSAPLAATFGPGWRSIGQAAKLHTEAYALLREADHQAHVAELAAVIPATEQARQLAEQEAETLAEAEHVALGAIRHAEDRHAEAVEHARECQDAAENAALVGEAPAVQVELLMAADKAKQVADQFAAKRNQARQDHARAVAATGQGRELVKALRTVEQAAKDALADAEKHPERAPRSLFTLSVGMTGAVSEWSALTEDERSTLRGLVADTAAAIGADRQGRAESRQAGYERGVREARHEARVNLAGMPAERGNVLPPGIR